jgi:hypothetical protein
MVFLIIGSLEEKIEELIEVERCICGLEDTGSRQPRFCEISEPAYPPRQCQDYSDIDHTPSMQP